MPRATLFAAVPTYRLPGYEPAHTAQPAAGVRVGGFIDLFVGGLVMAWLIYPVLF